MVDLFDLLVWRTPWLSFSLEIKQRNVWAKNNQAHSSNSVFDFEILSKMIKEIKKTSFDRIENSQTEVVSCNNFSSLIIENNRNNGRLKSSSSSTIK